MQVRRRVLDAWLHDLRVGWGERAYRSMRALAHVVAIAEPADLHSIGRELAGDGHKLDDILDWFQLLAKRSRPWRRILCEGGIANLASGWADGILQTDQDSDAVAPFEVLRLRVQQQVELAGSRGQAPGTSLALVVVDTDGATTQLPDVARHARETFHHGETMAVTPTGKLLILVIRDEEARRRTLLLTDALRLDDHLRGAPVRVWIEPLAMAAEHVDSHLLGLAS